MTPLEIPLFVPTSAGRIFGIVSLPEDDVQLEAPGVILLPGGRAGAGVLPLLQDIARSLAALGQPVLRFDYPGSGLSADVGALPQSELRGFVSELSDWFMSTTGISRLAVAGRCGGGRLAIALAADDPRVEVCVAAVPFFASRGSSLRSKLVELDARGPRLASRLIRAPRTESRRERLDPAEVAAGFASDLISAAKRSRTSLVFGERDALLDQFDAFVAGHRQELEEALTRIERVILPDARLHGLPNADHERQLGDAIRTRLAVADHARG